MKRPTAFLLALYFALCALHSLAAVPLKWTVETSRVQPVVFDAVRGETLALEASFKSYGTDVSTSNMTASLYWQTNGMASAWWVTNAVTSGSAASVLFTPAMDPGASTVQAFIGLAETNQTTQQSNNPTISYRAAFTLRFRHGPGATPNVIAAPVQTLDFAKIIVVNPPWPTTNTVREIAASASVTNAGAVAAAKYSASTSYVERADFQYGQDLQLPVKGSEYAQYAQNAIYATSVEKLEKRQNQTGLSPFKMLAWENETYDNHRLVALSRAKTSGIGTRDTIAFLSDATNLVSSATVTNGGAKAYTDAAVAGITASSIGAYSSASGEQLATSVSAISGHLNAEDAHFVSTNYDSSVRLPEAYVEVKIDGAWLTIWKEMRRWTAFVGSAFSWDSWGGFYAWGTNVTANISSLWNTKADRCWGIYDSETGGYSPEGYTQISSSNILIAANMAYQRTVTSGGNVWVLQCNTGTAHIGGDTNGFFRILDGDGNVQFEIIKGSKRELGADADGITVDNSTTPPTCTIPYSVVAAEHPKIYVCNDLATANWKDEDDSDCVANVTWTGSSGAWVASVQAKTAPAPKLFVKATYESGGETYIRNVAPVGMSSIYLNGTKYYLGTATIDGHTVLTLSTTAQ